MFEFTTKAATLKTLAPLLTKATVLPQLCLTVGEYLSNKERIFSNIETAGFSDKKLIFRSSAQNEDTAEQSNAGKFLSIGNISGRDAILEAADNVAKAMGDDAENEILIQPYLENVECCGVAFTVDPNTLGNYYVLNYDDTTGSTDSVTGGSGSTLKTFYCFKPEYEKAPGRLGEIIAACREIEEVSGNNAIDIEFAVSGGKIFIFQVRPLVLSGVVVSKAEQIKSLQLMKNKFLLFSSKQPNVLGDKAIFGVMPDWNPAEMIGIRPRPLALSLYKELITDNVWAYQRNNYGYRNMRSFPLMQDFCGLPYIDTRVSFNSFVPNELPDELAEKLVNCYIERLINEPSKHDKVEFEIAFTCYTLDLQKRIQILGDYGFTPYEIQNITDSLRNLTNHVVDSKNGLWKKDVQKIDILKKKHIQIIESDLGIPEKIYWLIEYCKRYGTLPFAGLARAGFIAVEFLKSMVNTGIITEEERSCYMNSLSTVGKKISNDFRSLTKPAFLKKYGHLRPGTYDITSPRYDSADSNYFDFDNKGTDITDEKETFKLTVSQFAMFNDALKKHGINADALQMFDFLKHAIEGREYAKFIFTQTLSDILEMLALLGSKYGFSRDDMSYSSIKTVMSAYTSCDDIGNSLRDDIISGKNNSKRTSSLTLPPLIFSKEQFVCFFMPDGEPNYITQKKCVAPIVNISDGMNNKELNGKIVMIKSADPGFDWIFSHNIQGFITAYGGVNSHMAIRAAELNIPAVIGVGEKRFSQYLTAKSVMIDCLNKNVRIYNEDMIYD